MGYASQAGQVGFGLQASQGIAVAATRFARIKGGSLGGERSLLIPDPEIGGHRDIASAYLGPVSYSGDYDFYVRPQMAALLLKAALGSSSSSGSAGANEVQTITTTGTPTGGTFTLTFRGQTTAPIAYNASSATVQTALRALGTIGSTGVTCGGGPLPTGVTVTFGGDLATTDVPLLTANYSALTGGTAPTVDIAASTPGTATIYTHTITPANTLPWVTVEERIGSGFESFQYVDAKVSTLKFDAEAGGFLSGSASLVAITQTAGFAAQATPAWDTTPMMVGGQVTVKFNGATLPASSFSLEINNGLETDDFRLGQLTLGDIVEKRREIKMSMSYRPSDSSLWKGAMYGATNLSAPQAGPAYQGPVQIVVNSLETIGDVVGGTKYSLTIDIPYAAIAPFKASPSGDDILSTDLELTALRPWANAPIITATVVNNLATVS